MKLSGITRDIIHLISRNSNWNAEDIDKTLKSDVYADKAGWVRFLNLFLLGLAVTFTVSGIIFFFAFNWNDLPKLFKIGIVEALVIASITSILLTNFNVLVKNIILSAAALLVGVMFAVFGQIYQTGADAYDFFLAWTVFVVIWAFTANFPPLWLIFLTLVNTTVWMYYEQVTDWETLSAINILFSINAFFLIIYETLHQKRIIHRPAWISYVVGLVAVTLITSGVIYIIMEESSSAASWCSLSLCTACFAGGILYGLLSKSIFYIAAILTAVVAIISFLIGKMEDDIVAFFFIGIFIVISITLIIKLVISLNKKWNGTE